MHMGIRPKELITEEEEEEEEGEDGEWQDEERVGGDGWESRIGMDWSWAECVNTKGRKKRTFFRAI